MTLFTAHQWNSAESGESMKSEVEPVPATRGSPDVPLGRKSSAISGPAGEPAHWSPEAPQIGRASCRERV